MSQRLWTRVVCCRSIDILIQTIYFVKDIAALPRASPFIQPQTCVTAHHVYLQYHVHYHIYPLCSSIMFIDRVYRASPPFDQTTAQGHGRHRSDVLVVQRFSVERGDPVVDALVLLPACRPVRGRVLGLFLRLCLSYLMASRSYDEAPTVKVCAGIQHLGVRRKHVPRTASILAITPRDAPAHTKAATFPDVNW